jgi:hypothetical protein
MCEHIPLGFMTISLFGQVWVLEERLSRVLVSLRSGCAGTASGDSDKAVRDFDKAAQELTVWREWNPLEHPEVCPCCDYF